MQQMHLHSSLFPLALVALSRLFKSGTTKDNPLRAVLVESTICVGIPALWLWVLDRPSAIGTAVLWRPLTSLASQWPMILLLSKQGQSSETAAASSLLARISQFCIQGGPLGRGCSKLIEAVVACLLWYCFRGKLPESIVATTNISPIRLLSTSSWSSSWLLAVGMVIVAAAVNGVLFLWSRYSQTNGSSGGHVGLNAYLQPTLRRKLTLKEHVQLLLLALINAACEECTSRGFWRSELEHTAGLSTQQSNVGQAIIFGAWHYYGIPSGWTGVALTTVYGWIMGVAADVTHAHFATSLAVPILLHTIADYYIFAVLARQGPPQKDI